MKPNSLQEGICADNAGKKKFSKPLMERRRRARINESLNELKNLVLSSMNKDQSKFTKMEKADVLELTVNYLKTLDAKEQPLNEIEQQRNFIAGYNECAREVQNYLLRTAEVSPQVKARMLTHISTSPHETNPTVISNSPKETYSTAKTGYPQATSVYPSPPASPVSNLQMRTMNMKPYVSHMNFSSENKASNFQDLYHNNNSNSNKKQPLTDKSIWRPWVSV